MAAVIVVERPDSRGPITGTGAISFVLHATLLLFWLVWMRAAPALPPLTEVLIPQPAPAPKPAESRELSAPAPSVPLPAVRLPSTLKSAPLPAMPAFAPAAAAMPAVRDLGKANDRALPGARDLGVRPLSGPMPSLSNADRPAPAPASQPVYTDRGRAPVSALPAAVSDRGVSLRRASVPAAQTARRDPVRTPRGIRIEGPLGDRALESYRLPDYPDWARQQGVQAEVALRCEVAADGSVSEVVLVERSSGYSDLDERAKAALARFRFTAIPGAEVQWGVVSFRYELH